jgi:hypothetical protein
MAKRALPRTQVRLAIVSDEFQVVHGASGPDFRKIRARRRV